MSDRTAVHLKEAMGSLTSIAPDAPPLPSIETERKRTPMIPALAGFAAVIAFIGLTALAATTLFQGDGVDSTIPPATTAESISGIWISNDLPVGTQIRLTIDASGTYDLWDERVISGPCAGGTVTSGGTGWFSDDSFVAPRTNRVCQPDDGANSFPMADIEPPMTFVWNSTSDTLTLVLDGGCYYRQGSSPTACE